MPPANLTKRSRTLCVEANIKGNNFAFALACHEPAL